LGAFLGLFEAFIELVADVTGETGDFTVAGVHSFCGLMVVSVFQLFDMAYIR
jgi:hypothetical protein